MLRHFLVLTFLLGISAGAHAQTAARLNHSALDYSTGDRPLAARAISLLKTLDEDVFVYRSLGEFEAGRKLSRVSLETFDIHLKEAAVQVDSLLASINDPRLKTEIRNALASYRDGAFWWQKIPDQRVVNVSRLSLTETEPAAADKFFAANIPYTVAIQWRQARKYLERAQSRLAELS